MQSQERPLDILITGGTLLTMEAGAEIIADPVIAIRDGKILFARARNSSPGWTGAVRETIDASGCLIMPGLVNTHTHLPMTLFRGLADDLPLMRWLNDYIFPAEGQFINAESVHTGTLLAIAEMILSGTTTFCDGYFFADAVAQAAVQAGMRGVVAQGFIDFPALDPPALSRHAAQAHLFMSTWSGRSPLITPALICHSPYACLPETLQTIKDAARRYGAPFLIHVSETREEVSLVRERHGKSPARHLHDLGLLDEATIAAHCVWMEEEELDLLARQGVKVSHDPESNMKLGAGVAPLPAMLARGIEIGLGTDGCASNNNLDLFGEMDMCAKLHKVVSADPTVLGAERVVEMATLGGARVLGLADRIGSIAPGKEADLILLDMNQPHWTPLYNPFSHLVYAASGADVRTSIIGGRIVMRDRRLLTLDAENVMAEAHKIAAAIVAAGCNQGSVCGR